MPISTAVFQQAVARVVGIKTEFRDLSNGSVRFLEQRLAVVGQGSSEVSYPITPLRVTSAQEVGDTYGYGSPVHLASKQLFPVNGNGGVGALPVTIYPLIDAITSTAAISTITPAGAQTEAAQYRVVVGGVYSDYFVINVGDTVADICSAIDDAMIDVADLPVEASSTATEVTLTSKWQGTSANKMVVSVEGSNTAGTTFTVVQPSGGLVNPDVSLATSQIGTVWETAILNCLELDDDTALDEYQTFGEGRWGALTRKPLCVFTGGVNPDVSHYVDIAEDRGTDRVNIQLPNPGSPELSFVSAAGMVAPMLVLASENPAHDYGSQTCPNLAPGADSDQWLYNDQQLAVTSGCSTINVFDGVVTLADTVTMYHPLNDPLPAYRYFCDIVKLQNIIYNLSLEFATAKWDGAPLIPDNQPTTNPDAKKPKTAVAAANAIIDSLGLTAMISDPETAKTKTRAQINEQNPKRLDLVLTVQLAGNANVISIDLDFGFYFGQAQLVA